MSKLLKKNYKKKLGTFLKESRIKCGLSQSDISSKFGFTNQYVSNWENNKCSPSFDIIFDLCELFNITEDKILEVMLSDTIAEFHLKSSERLKEHRKNRQA